MTRLALSVSLALHAGFVAVLAELPRVRIERTDLRPVLSEQGSAAFLSPESLVETDAPPAEARPLPPEWKPAGPSIEGTLAPPALPAASLIAAPAVSTSTLSEVPIGALGAGRATPGTTERNAGRPPPARRGVAGTPGANSRSVAADLPARFSFHPAPPYPTEARARRWEGIVQLLLSVDASGTVKSAQLLRSSGYVVLDRAALETARQWRFIPARLHGLPVASRVEVPVRFRYENKGTTAAPPGAG